jgi:hypothetical protein
MTIAVEESILLLFRVKSLNSYRELRKWQENLVRITVSLAAI